MRHLLVALLLILAFCGYAVAAPTASRTTGVAPLAVHFWADVAASTPSSRPFHDLEYSWDFGDTGSGTWGTSSLSRNTDKGPVAAHVYDTAGTYTATLTIRNSLGVVGTPTNFTITVTNPDTVYAANKTTCISTGTDFTGCPAGATQVPSQSNLSVLSNYTDAGERVLLRRGDSWTVSTSPSFPNNSGPVHIGAFGICSSPDELGICSNAPSITMTTSPFVDLSHNQDWRLADIRFVGSKSIPSVAQGNTNNKRNLIYRIDTDGFETPIGWGIWRTQESYYPDALSVISCRSLNTSRISMYLGSERLAVMGNIVQNSDTTHILRVWQAYQGIISHNILSGSSLTNTEGRHALKLHGPSHPDSPGTGTKVGTVAEIGPGSLRYYTQFVVVANNLFGSSGASPVEIGPQNQENQERLSDIIFEKNRMLADYGQKSPVLVAVHLFLRGRYMTARNNILDGSGGNQNSYTGIAITQHGTDNAWNPLGNRIYNNTVYNTNTLVNRAWGFEVQGPDLVAGKDGAEDTIIKNNYVSYPNKSGATLITDTSPDLIQSDNVLTSTPHFIDPNNTNPLARDFRITSSASVAVDKGDITPLLDDYYGSYRTGVYDIGMHEYGGSALTCEHTPTLCTTKYQCETDPGSWYWDGTECLMSEPAADPTCSDGIQNGDEGGIDCDGSCDPCNPPIAGECGFNDDGTFYALYSDTVGNCDVGAVSDFSGTGPWTWICLGTDGGQEDHCSASLKEYVSGQTIQSGTAKFRTGTAKIRPRVSP